MCWNEKLDLQTLIKKSLSEIGDNKEDRFDRAVCMLKKRKFQVS